MISCPLKSLKSWKSLVKEVGSTSIAHSLWDAYEGNVPQEAIDRYLVSEKPVQKQTEDVLFSRVHPALQKVKNKEQLEKVIQIAIKGKPSYQEAFTQRRYRHNGELFIWVKKTTKNGTTDLVAYNKALKLINKWNYELNHDIFSLSGKEFLPDDRTNGYNSGKAFKLEINYELFEEARDILDGMYDSSIYMNDEDSLIANLFKGDKALKNFSPIMKDTSWDDRRAVDMQKEVEILGRTLPNIPVNIKKGLLRIPGGLSEGTLYEGFINLYTGAKEGVGMHEAFHAVTQMYLDGEAREDLYKEAKEIYGLQGLDNAEIEERLAEEFRDYMITNEYSKSSLIKKFFDGLKQLMNFFRGIFNIEKGEDLDAVQRLFRDIQQGRFAYPPINRMKGTKLHSAINTERLNLPSDLVRDTVQGAAYQFFKMSNLPGLSSEFDMAANMDGVENVLVDVFNHFYDKADEAAEAGNMEVASKIDTVLLPENWDKLKPLILAEVTKWNFTVYNEKVEEDAEEKQEENLQGDLNIINAVNQSIKQNASGNTKALVAMLQDTSKTSAHFGTYIPRLADFNKTWSILVNGLANTAATKSATNVENMLSKLKKLSESYTPLVELVTVLESEKTALNKKIGFYRTFDKTLQNYTTTLSEEVGTDIYKSKVVSSDAQSSEKQIVRGWVAGYTQENFTQNALTSKARLALNVAKGVFNSLYSEALDIRQPLTRENYPLEIQKVLSHVGIDMKVEAVKDFLNSFGNTKRRDNLRDALIKLQPLFVSKEGYGRKSIDKYFERKVTDKEGNVIKTFEPIEFNPDSFFLTDNNSILSTLASFQAPHVGLQSEDMVRGADGKSYYKVTLNNYVSRTVSEWKADSSLVRDLKKKSYHKGSHWLNIIADRIENKKEFGIKTFLQNKLQDSEDVGQIYTELEPVDDTLERMYRVLKSYNGDAVSYGADYSPLTIGDKSVWNFIHGMPFYKLGLKSKSDLKTTSPMVSIFYNYALAELERISYNLKNPSKVVIYNNKSKESFWFKELSRGGSVAEQLQLFNVDGSLNLNEQGIKEYIVKSLQDTLDKEVKKIYDLGIVKKNSITGLSLDVQMNYEAAKEGVYPMLSDYILNQMVANIETTMLFTGDPAYYKDLSKRIQEITSTGDGLIELEGNIPKTFKLGVMTTTVRNLKEEDPTWYKNTKKALATNIKSRKKLSKEAAEQEADEILKPYTELKQDDGQGWITPKRFRDIASGLGMWTSEHEKLFNILMQGQEGNNYPKYYADFNALAKKLYFPDGQPYKGQFYDMVEDGSQMRPVYLKYSQAVLWPGLVKGSKLENLLKNMEASGVDEMVGTEAIKVGASDIHNSQEVLAGDFAIKSIELRNSGWKLQNDLSAKYTKSGKVTTGSQLRKNILCNLEGKTFTINGEKVDGVTLAKMIQEVDSKISDATLDKFSTQFESETSYYDTFYANLIDKFKKDGVSTNILEALEAGVNLDTIIQGGDTLEAGIHSALNKASVRLKNHGGAFIQMSNAGFSKLEGISTPEQLIKDVNNIIYLKDQSELRGPSIVGGVVKPGDIFLPYKAIKDIPNIKQRIADGLTIAELKTLMGDTLNVIGYRIPNQNITSIDSLEIAGILPEYLGDTVVTFTEIVGKTGSDFDIDKMYMMMPNVQWDAAQGKLVKINDDSIAGLENKRIDLYRTVLEDAQVFPELITPLDSSFLSHDAYYVEFLREIGKDTKSVLKAVGANTLQDFLSNPNKKEIAYNYFKNKEFKTLEFATPSYQLRVKTLNMAGKAGTAQTANQLVHHPLAQLAKLAFDRVLTDRGMSEEGKSILYSQLNKDNNLISQVISAWINAYVDCAKDPYIALINNNTTTSGVVFMLIRNGVSPEWVNRFTSQPIIEEYVKQTQNKKSRFFPKKTQDFMDILVNNSGELYEKERKNAYITPTAATLSKYIEGVDFNLSVNEDLIGDVKNLEQQIIKSDNQTQVEILKQFLVFQTYASSLTDAVKTCKYDTKGSGASAAENIAAKELFNKASEDTKLVNFINLFEDTYMETCRKNSSERTEDFYGNRLISETPAMQKMLQAFAADQGIDFMVNPDLNQKLIRAYKSYVYSQADFLQITDKALKDMFYGDYSMSKKLMKIKKLLPDNVFIQALGFTAEVGKPSFIILPSTKVKDPTETEVLWQQWEKLLNKVDEGAIQLYEEVDYSVADFMMDLVKMSYYTSGFNKNPNSYHDLIPNTFLRGVNNPSKQNLNSFISEKLRELQELNVFDDFLNDMYRNEYQEDSIVSGATFYNTEDYSNPTAPKEPNYDSLRRKGLVFDSVHDLKYKGFVMSNDTFYTPFAAHITKLGDTSVYTPKPYIKTVNGSTKETSLYKYIGEKEGLHYFEAIEKLSYYSKGNKIYQYGSISSVVEEQKLIVGFGKETKQNLTFNNIFGKRNVGIGAFREIAQDTYKAEDMDVTFKIVPVERKGKTYYQGVISTSNMKDIVTHADLGYNKTDALSLMKQELNDMSYEKLVFILNNKC